MEGGGERKNAESVFCPPPPPFFSFDLGYVFSRLYLFLYEAQSTRDKNTQKPASYEGYTYLRYHNKN